MKEWFTSLAPRERLLVTIAGIVTLAGLFFLLVWEPLVTANDNLEQQVISAQELNNWLTDVEDQAVQLRRSGQRNSIKGRDQSLLSLVDETSRNAGLGNAVRRIQPEGGDQAVVTLEEAGFNQMLFWLSNLEKEYGIRATALTVSRGEKTGKVQARMTLKRST